MGQRLPTSTTSLEPDQGLTLLGHAGGVRWLAVPGWDKLGWLRHGFSTRLGGVSTAYQNLPNGAADLNLGFTPADSPENVCENRRRFVEAITGSVETPLITVRQIHSNLSVLADTAFPAVEDGPPCEADGLITNRPGVLLGILTADCIPVLLVDPERRVAGAFHAGWRGTVERIVELGVARMQREYGSDPSALMAAIGPGIGGCCYTVGEEVRSRFAASFSYAAELFSTSEPGDSDPDNRDPVDRETASMRLDLIEANRRQLLAAGLDPARITLTGACTICQPDLFFSHRATGGHAGRMMAAIGIFGTTASPAAL